MVRLSRSGVTCEISARAVANIIDAPSPWIAREPTRTSIPPAAPHSAELTVKIARPMMNSRRRPSRSAIAPAVRTVAASGIVYASTSH